MGLIKESLRRPLLIVDLLVKNKNSDYQSDKITQMNMLSKGFLGHSKTMYNLTSDNYKLYLTDYQQTKTGKINRKHSYLLNNKVAFEQVFSNYIPIPKTLATIVNGELIPLEEQLNNIDTLLDYLNENKKVIVKPISGSKGQGIFTIELKEQNIFIDNIHSKKCELEEKLKDLNGYFISEYIQQGKFENQLYPKTLNTIRMLTMIDPHTNDPFIPAAVQRIGTHLSEPTDNFSRGGLNANIDLETGVLSQATTFPYNGELKWHEQHPDTHAQIEGLTVPNWGEIKEAVLNVAKKNSYINYVGWDVVLTDTGMMIIEGNSWPDIDLIQIHKPLLKDKRVYGFYKYHKII